MQGLLCLGLLAVGCDGRALIPAVINTWGFTSATEKAWHIVRHGGDGLDAVEEGCHVCEVERCDGTVGWGGSEDTNGETTLDAMIMDGRTMDIGAVAALRRIKNAIGVARKVLHHTAHTLLVGDQATQFAVENFGFKEESLTSDWSRENYNQWKERECQPNFFRNMVNDTTGCPPYSPASFSNHTTSRSTFHIGPGNHDTIGMVVVDRHGHVTCGTSTNGALHKIAGRVGDSPIPGAGAYCDDEVGGAAGTGDGDIMMRFLPAFHAVQLMRGGMSPIEAAEAALRPIIRKYPSFSGSIVVINNRGEYGAASHGYTFPVAVANPSLGRVTVKEYPPM